MTSVTMPIGLESHPHLRPLNIMRDLPSVADLIELCFSSTMDRDGQRYVQDMRKAGADGKFLSWAAKVNDTTALPLSGYIWEEDGRVVGNTSLVPFRHENQRIYLIANVAVHPDYRRKGIARALTERALEHATQKKAGSVWLHVRVDNPGAIQMYTDLGFVELSRRTSWTAPVKSPVEENTSEITITPRQPSFWPLQKYWLERTYPAEMNWHRPWNFSYLKPGFLNWLWRFMIDVDIKQWAALRGNHLEAVLAYIPTNREETLFAAVNPQADPVALTTLLREARKHLVNRAHVSIELPAGEYDDALEAAGYVQQRTLIWMRQITAT
jgi:ribosomal protein S18 acetylase RimI-like enzyme